MNLACFLIKDIFQKKLRVFMTLSGIAIGICVCVMMLGISSSIKRSFQDVFGQRQIDIIVQEREQLSILLGRVDAVLVQGLRQMAQVEDVSATLLYLNKLKGTAVPVFGWEAESFLFRGVEIEKGRIPFPGKNEVMVGDALMKSLSRDNAAQIKIKGESFDVVGVFKSSSPFEQFAAVTALSDLQNVIHEPGRVSFINVRLKPKYRSEAAIEKIIPEIERDFAPAQALRADAFVAEKTKFILVGQQFSFLISLITIIAVILGLANTMVTSSFEKRKFHAILLALGWQKYEIALLFVGESLVIALLGGALGLFLGFKGEQYLFNFTSIHAFAPVLSVGFILKITGIILASSVIAAIVPTWITLNSHPVEVIRGE